MKKGIILFAIAIAPFSLFAQKAKAPVKKTVTTTAPAVTAAHWDVDKAHTSLKFTVQHLVISEVEGVFKMFDGSVESKGADFNNASVNFTVDVASVNTGDEKRDGHLKSDDFFNAEKYPRMTFNSTSFKKIKGNMYVLEGNLTIRDVTKKVKWAVIFNGTVKDPWGNVKAGFKATTKINRKEYGLKWNVMTEAGGTVVGDEVAITVNAEFTQKK